MKNKTRELVLAAILTALAILITYSPVKLNTGFFTLTLGAHVPTMLAMFISHGLQLCRLSAAASDSLWQFLRRTTCWL